MSFLIRVFGSVNKVFLDIALNSVPVSLKFTIMESRNQIGEDLEAKLGLVKGNQITPNLVDRQRLIKRHFDDKGFKNAEVVIVQRDDVSVKNKVIVDINIDKKAKVKVHQITITGNSAITAKKLKRVMKKTNEKGQILNLFRTKKFVNEKYAEDKQLIIDNIRVGISRRTYRYG